MRLERAIDLPAEPGFWATDLDWAGDDRLVLATSRGLETLDLSTSRLRPLVAAAPLPEGVLDPHGVASDGEHAVVYSLRYMSLSAWDLVTGARVFAFREPPGFMIADVAAFAGGVALLGFPRGAGGRMANPALGAVWAGPLAPGWSGFWPLHVLRGGERSARRFESALWPLGGALARMPDGSLCVATAAEPGVFCYGVDGRLRGEWGKDLVELVGHGLERAFGEFAGSPRDRYARVVNRQPWIDGLIAVEGGPALVVRRADGETVRWDLRIPSADGPGRVVPLPLAVAYPMAHLRGEARGRRFAAVVRTSPRRETPRWRVVVFRLPRLER